MDEYIQGIFKTCNQKEKSTSSILDVNSTVEIYFLQLLHLCVSDHKIIR